ncbi:hypothetical protein ACWDCB_28695 [Streptomyces sp. NPDC001178]
MPRTARVLSVAALAGATLGFASAAYADSAAETGSSSVSPGGGVTVSVACEATGGPPPATLGAVSHTHAGSGHPATVDGTCATAPGSTGKAWSAASHVNRGDGSDGAAVGESGSDGGVSGDGGGGTGGHADDGGGGGGRGDNGGGEGADLGGGAVGGDAGDGDGHDQGRPCTEQDSDSCGGTGLQNGREHDMQHGVDAGAGGTFSDSVPALVAGGLLIVCALGAAAYRMWPKDSVWDR